MVMVQASGIPMAPTIVKVPGGWLRLTLRIVPPNEENPIDGQPHDTINLADWYGSC